MNQGSASLSGSYGVSGISKLTGALSGYVGNASAKGGKNMKVSYQIIVRGGLEYIDLDNLNPALLISALSKSAQARILRALGAYQDLEQALEHLPKDSQDPPIYSVIKDAERYKAEFGKYQQWLRSVDDFKRACGDGIVVQVVWGGVGIVDMEIGSDSGESVWKYGGETDFSYAGVGATVSVGATYDGSQSKEYAGVHASLGSFSSGSCVDDQTTAWFKALDGKSFQELADVKVLARAPDMTAKAAIRTPPEFITPKVEKSLTDKISQIKDLDGLKAYATAAAYDKAKADNKNLTLEDFINTSGKRANAAKLDLDIDNLMTEIDEMAKKRSNLGEEEGLQLDMVSDLNHSATAGDDPFIGYSPIGIKVASWDHLFPWLATGNLNSIVDAKSTRPMIIHRAMLQDCLALSRLYYIAHSSELNLGFSAIQVADDFAQAASRLQSGLLKQSLRDPEAYARAASDALGKFGTNTKEIYKIWCEVSFLRDCNLGLGLLVKSPVSKDKWCSPSIPAQHSDDKSLMYAAAAGCAFDPTVGNYAAFATFYKLLPLIFPSGEIRVFGPGGFLVALWEEKANVRPENIYFDRNSPKLCPPLTADKAGRFLESNRGPVSYRLYPVPFSAAEGVQNWKGQSFSTGLASLSGLTSALSDLQKDIGQRLAWSLTSEAWPEGSSAEDYYAEGLIAKQYIGLVEEEDAL
ncbi:hypothetical protein CVN68_03315 [Sphingomonas psychrotolerans]|uniref:Uncharacterized protein n=2 Tax=Sphingomonas psychrotolerans TaxID=1327635 RepID=A0A2K8MB59_9SPHN|nr:hypothetical protein CVN68_03315 [Sphingomonas psychrotolerans]